VQVANDHEVFQIMDFHQPASYPAARDAFFCLSACSALVACSILSRKSGAFAADCSSCNRVMIGRGG